MKKFLATILILMLTISGTCTYAQNILCENTNIITDEATLQQIAVTVPKEQSSFSVDAESEKLYYDNGKVYKTVPTKMEEVTQKVSTLSRGFETTENYVTDCFVTCSIMEKILTPAEIDALGVQKNTSTVIDSTRASFLQWSDEDEGASNSMKIRYTVYYKKLSSWGIYINLYAITHSYGKVVYADTGSGIYPTDMTFNVGCYGYACNYSTGQNLGVYSHTDSMTVNSPDVGESVAYFFDTGDDNIYYEVVQGNKDAIGTNLIVHGTRGVNLSVYYNPPSA